MNITHPNQIRSSVSVHQPKVSIVVPTYNRSDYIIEMIESVISQTYQNWELIIVDDGSTDNTKSIIKPYISEKIRYYDLEHTGRSYARNYGIKKSTGDFISYLDSDDVFLNTKTEKQVNWLLNHPEYAMVYASALRINDFGEYSPLMYLAERSGHIYKDIAMFIPITITLPSVMIRKEIQEIIGGFDEGLDRFEDTDMWRRVARDYKIGALIEPLLKVRTHQENRLEILDPEKTFCDVQKYIRKVKIEDGKKYGLFIAKGSARLYHYYAVAFLHIPAWREWTKKLFFASFFSHPIYFIFLSIKSLQKFGKRFIKKGNN